MKEKKGFTLVELLIAILIIGVLVGVALPQYRLAKDKAQYSAMMNIGRAIAESNERYYIEHNKTYATSFDQLDVNIPANSFSGNTAYFDWGNCRLYYQQEVHCTNNTSLRNQFIIHYNRGSRDPHVIVCTAQGLAENNRYNKVCKSFGKYSGACPGCCADLGDCGIYYIRH